LFDLMKATDPLFVAEPNTGWAYSNTAYVLLGLLIAKVSGKPCSEFYQQRLFGPAGLQDTAVDDAAFIAAQRASGYTPNPSAVKGFDNASFISMTFPGAAGSIRSTGEDLCRWHEALFGGRVINPNSLRQMLMPGRLGDGSKPLSLFAAGPISQGAPINYGFGLSVDVFAGHPSIEHGGGINGFASQLRSFPSDKVTIALLTNTDGNARLAERASALSAAATRLAFSGAGGRSR
jgi:D-alanyl-D-alanine carboxypeptidase